MSATTEFESALRYSHKGSFYGEILRLGRVVVGDLPIVGGTITADSSALVRRSGTIQLVDRDGTLTPTGNTDELAPEGNELRIWRGIELPSGVENHVLGIMRIATVNVVDAGRRTIEVTCYDRSRVVSRAGFEAPYSIAANTNLATAIQTLVDSRYPGLSYSLAPTDATSPNPLVFLEEMDPWSEAQSLAASIGMELYFDRSGIVVLRPQPNPTFDQSVWHYNEDSDATVLAAENRRDDEPGYNGFIAIGEPPDAAPVSAFYWDIDPASSTYSGYDPTTGTFAPSAYGRHARKLRSPFIRTQAQANQAAYAGYLRERGGTEQLTFSAVPDPARDAGDVVRFTRTQLSIDDFFIIDRLTIPLNVQGEMTITARKRRVT